MPEKFIISFQNKTKKNIYALLNKKSNLRRNETNAMISVQPFTIERTYDAPIEKAWNALTDKDQMKKWYFDLPAFEPVVGFEFRFYGQGHTGEQYLHFCKVTEVVPGKKISYSWRYDKYEGNSEVSFELFAEGNKTRLKLTHDGLETFPANNPDFAKQSFTDGWTMLVGALLKDFIEQK